jgi:hypothetical protein
MAVYEFNRIDLPDELVRINRAAVGECHPAKGLDAT